MKKAIYGDGRTIPRGQEKAGFKAISHGFGVRKQVVDGLAFYVLQNVFDVAVRIQTVDDCDPDDREQLGCVYCLCFASRGLKHIPIDNKRLNNVYGGFCFIWNAFSK